MANGDVDAINERLNGLVNLLQVVGIDGVDSDALVEEQRRVGGATFNSNRGAAPQQSSDAQILELIKKLQLAQADSPEILAALQSPELRALASLAAQKQANDKSATALKKSTPALDDVIDDDDDNYPKIGPGYSDDISVVSDMTTPTVMTRQQVAEEEHYLEVNGGPSALLPMHLSTGAAQPARPTMGVPTQRHYGGKTKNLVGQIRPVQPQRAIAKPGGAAAQRRLNYQMAMTKLQSGVTEASSPRKAQKDVFAPSSPTPSQQTPMEFPSMNTDGSGGKSNKKGKEKIPSLKKSKKTALAAQEVADLDFESTEPITTPATSASSGSTNGVTKKKSPAIVPTDDIDWGMSQPEGWSAFESNKIDGNGQDIFVDGNGFFQDDAFASNDAFGSGAKPSGSSVKSPKPRSATGGRKTLPSKKLSAGRLKKEGEAAKKEKGEKPGKKKSRARSSLTM